MAKAVELPIIDLACSDCNASARSIRQACTAYGFFYLINHGVEESLLQKVLEGNKVFFSLCLEEKMKLAHKNYRGYTPLYAETLDSSSSSRGDSKEGFYIGPLEDTPSHGNLNQWPSDEILPGWRSIMEDYYKQVMNAGKRLLKLFAMALNLDKNFFSDVGAFNPPNGLLRLIHYPGELGSTDEEIYGASAHSDYGMITLLATDGIHGLQICKEKFKEPRVWENVHHVPGSTLHQVVPTGQERYSVAFFFDPSPDCVVECLKSCCNESAPPRFPPIRAGDYLEERFKATYGS